MTRADDILSELQVVIGRGVVEHRSWKCSIGDKKV